MNFILQDIVEPKVLGDSLHLHPVFFSSCLLILLDRDHRLSRGLGDYSGVYRRCAGGSAHCVLQNRDA